MLATKRSKRSSLGSYNSSTSSHEYGDLGSRGDSGEGKARAMMLGEAPTPAGDIEAPLIVQTVHRPLFSLRTQPRTASIESIP